MLAMEVTLAANKNNDATGEVFAFDTTMQDYMPGREENLIAMKASSNPGTMYLHQGMNQSDKREFVQAMKEEVKNQIDNENYTINKQKNIPPEKSKLPAVWQMKRKRDIQLQKIKKCKACLNIDGSPMKKGIHTTRHTLQWRPGTRLELY